MKTNRRLKAAADFRNHPHGYLVMDLGDWDGGDFDLHARSGEIQINDNTFQPAIYLPSTDAPGYRVAVTGSPDVLKRFANALQALARNADGDDDDTDE